MTKKLTINPITRLEGHGKIEIFLDDNGGVKDAYFQVVELRASKGSAWADRRRKCRG